MTDQERYDKPTKGKKKSELAEFRRKMDEKNKTLCKLKPHFKESD